MQFCNSKTIQSFFLGRGVILLSNDFMFVSVEIVKKKKIFVEAHNILFFYFYILRAALPNRSPSETPEITF